MTWREVIEHIAKVSDAIARQAGVGGRETAGAIISYLAVNPDQIYPFLNGEVSPLDWGDDFMRGGCLSWHGADGKVWTPEAARAAREAAALARGEKAHV